MKFRSASLLVMAIACSMFVLAPAVLVYVVDPFRIYHKSYFAKAGYSGEQSWQIAGWINTVLSDPAQIWDGLVIGSSVASDYSSTLVNQYLHWGNTMNLSVHGSSPVMQATIARYALHKRPQIRHILWDIHFQYVKELDYLRLNPANPFPYYLYNDSPLDDREYFFNVTNVSSSLKFLMGNFDGFMFDIAHNGPLYEGLLAAGRFEANGSLKNMQDVLQPQIHTEELTIPDVQSLRKFAYPSIDRDLLEIVLPFCNSDKDIVLLFSPEARFAYSSSDADFVRLQLGMRRYVVEKVQACHNIRVFAFDNVDWITTNLRNYADSFHYVIDVNHYVLQSIANNENQLTVSNIRDYETTFIDKVNTYRKHFSDYVDREREISVEKNPRTEDVSHQNP